MKNIIFFAGIHGVGKNFILNNARFSKTIVHLTASDVLKWREISKNPDDKRVVSISNTQDALITNLRKIVKENQYYILDGHLTLLNKEGKIERIPKETFFKINPRILIVKTAEPTIIQNRLKQRDNKEWDIDDITLMQDEEITYAKDIASMLNIPFYQLGDNQEELLNSIINLELQNG